MCLVFLVYKTVPTLPMVLFQNRDEFFNREFETLNEWQGIPELYAPKDIPSGGTWMGVTTSGRFATITNYRDPAHRKETAPSRGQVVLEFLKSKESVDQFIQKLTPRIAEYNGFNLIFGSLDELYYFSSRSGKLQKLNPGIYALSNAGLNTPWPKVVRGLQKIESMDLNNLSGNIKNIQDAGISLLQDSELAPDKNLPTTGLPLDWERNLSSIFVKLPSYGTVASSVLIQSEDGNIKWFDRYYGPSHEGQYSKHSIRLKS